MKFSFSYILWAIFLGYLGHSVWTIYGIFHPPICKESGSRCLQSYIEIFMSSKYALSMFVSTTNKKIDRDLTLIRKWDNFSYDSVHELNINVTLPQKTRNNGSLFVHAFLHRASDDPLTSGIVSYAQTALTTYMIPRATTFNLFSNTSGQNVPGILEKAVTHWYSKVTVNIMADKIAFDRKEIPYDIHRLLREVPEKPGFYFPILIFDEMGKRIQNLVPVNNSIIYIPLTLRYEPISVGRLRMWLQLGEAMKTLHGMGFSEKDTDEIKGILSDTNFYLLMLTFVVSAFHLVFDFLAFKNDINYWKNRDNLIGVSSRTVIWRCFSTFVIFLYLMDEDTSLLVLIPAGVGSLIEFWKVAKAFKIRLSWGTSWLPRLTFGSRSSQEKETEAFDTEAMQYLSYLLYPLCIGGSVYSLLYVEHKSWYSWCIQSLVNGIYAFGFLFMLPQLFVNYKLKSVAHLPWRAFMYKAFNTFIDDVFAFIITMPTAHRLACFRDDVVFVIYLYQRWLYPVDVKRVNEYGQTFDDTNKNSKKDD